MEGQAPFRGRVFGRVFSPTRYPDNSEIFYPGFELFLLHDPGQIAVAGIEDGTASKAGVRSGDVIVSVNGVLAATSMAAQSAPRYRINISVNINNLTNHSNLIGYSGVYTSRTYLQPTSVAGVRRINFNAGISF
jgi:predicted metalloprotease with PDZ domain